MIMNKTHGNKSEVHGWRYYEHGMKRYGNTGIHTVSQFEAHGIQYFITVVGWGGGGGEGWGKDVNPHRPASHSISQLRIHEETGPIPPCQ
jgi:hypothetical protein